LFSNFSVSLDWYDIDIENVIAPIAGNTGDEQSATTSTAATHTTMPPIRSAPPSGAIPLTGGIDPRRCAVPESRRN
jgi:hypothetical protein